MRLSWSRINAYRRCPMAFRLEYLDKAPKVVPDYVKDGNISHKFLEAVLDGSFLASPPRPADEVVDELRASGDHDKVPERIMDVAADVVGRIEIPDGPGARAWVEQRIYLDGAGRLCDPGDDPAFMAIVDYMMLADSGRTLYVRDWKTGYGEGDPATDLDQVTLYGHAAMALLRAEGLPEPEQIVVAIDRVLKPSASREATITPLEAERRFVELVVDLGGEIIQAEEFESCLGEQCGTCMVRKSCPAYRELAEGAEVAPRTWDTPAAAFQAMKLYEALAKDAREAAMAMLEAGEDATAAAGKRVGIKTTKAIKLDPALAFAALERAGVADEEIIARASISKTAVQRLVKDRDMAAAIVEECTSKIDERNQLVLENIEDKEAGVIDGLDGW